MAAFVLLSSADSDGIRPTWERGIHAGGSIVPTPCCFEEFPPLDRFTDGDFERLVATYRLARVAVDDARGALRGLGIEATDPSLIGVLAAVLGVTVDDFGDSPTLQVAVVRSCEVASGYPRSLCAQIVEAADFR